jgi:alpha-methylacyl-CoA racemase
VLPLDGIRVLEVSTFAPTAFVGMLLSDMGAEVIRIERPEADRPISTRSQEHDTLARGGRPSIVLDLKKPGAAGVVLAAMKTADVFVEGFRPGVCERLGIGPTEALAANPKLIYTRLTGWGQTGPYADLPGHDINYLAVCGALHPMGDGASPPAPPLNLIGDFAGGGYLAVMGILAALLERNTSGKGQSLDVAMLDGCALLTATFQSMRASGRWRDERASNLLDGAAPHYSTYETADGGFLAVGAIEVKFRSILGALLDLGPEFTKDCDDPAAWPRLKKEIAARFITRTRDEWMADERTAAACVSPVLSPGEVLSDRHIAERVVYKSVGQVIQPAAAPRFSRTPLKEPRIPDATERTDELISGFGLSDAEIAALRASGAVC